MSQDWMSSNTQLPERDKPIEWLDPTGKVCRGVYAGVWLLDSGMYVYYTPQYWRYAGEKTPHAV